MLMDRESAFKKLFIGFKKGRNSKEKKNKTKAKERYVIKPKKFENRYEWERDLKNGYSRYKPTGKVIAVEVTSELLKNLGKSFTRNEKCDQ